MHPPSCPCHAGIARRRVLLLLGGTALAGCSADALGGLGLVPEAEIQRMGEITWRRTLAEKQVSRDPQADARVRRVVQRIVQANGLQGRDWEVAVFEDPSPNAFALPGGYIGVNTGLLRLAETDDQLATVIGHEIGHVTADHSAERVNAQAASEVGVQVLTAALGGGNPAQANMIAGLLGAGATYGLILPYSRDQELEADAIGVRYMDRAGYDPSAALAFWQEMRRASQGGAPPEFLSTHPSDERRIERLRELVAQAGG
jgi:predicted Zn-dependent protease